MGVTSIFGMYVIRFSVRRSLYAVLQKVLVESCVSWCSSVSMAVRSSPRASDAAALSPSERTMDNASDSARVLRKNFFISCLQKVSGGGASGRRPCPASERGLVYITLVRISHPADKVNVDLTTKFRRFPQNLLSSHKKDGSPGKNVPHSVKISLETAEKRIIIAAGQRGKKEGFL